MIRISVDKNGNKKRSSISEENAFNNTNYFSSIVCIELNDFENHMCAQALSSLYGYL